MTENMNKNFIFLQIIYKMPGYINIQYKLIYMPFWYIFAFGSDQNLHYRRDFVNPE